MSEENSITNDVREPIIQSIIGLAEIPDSLVDHLRSFTRGWTLIQLVSLEQSAKAGLVKAVVFDELGLVSAIAIESDADDADDVPECDTITFETTEELMQ